MSQLAFLFRLDGVETGEEIMVVSEVEQANRICKDSTPRRLEPLRDDPRQKEFVPYWGLCAFKTNPQIPVEMDVPDFHRGEPPRAARISFALSARGEVFAHPQYDVVICPDGMPPDEFLPPSQYAELCNRRRE